MSKTKKSLKQYCDEIDIWDGWRDSYQRFVPKFINEAKTKTDWLDWDKDVFFEFFERSNDQCVSSLQQGYFTKEEQQNIKLHWNEIAPLLKNLAENQEEPQWKMYQQIKKTIRVHTNLDRKAATNRIIASLQPNLLCTIVNEGNLWELFDKLNKHSSDEIPEFTGGDWFKNSYNIRKLFQQVLQPQNAMDIVTYPWQMLEYLKEIQKNQIDMDNYIIEKAELLGKVHNLIFTGAPGTGKTYLAKQIAKQVIGAKTEEELEKSGQFAFVQFHPSYDYTDFVEGLRPTQPDENGNIGFELKNGIFKDFCEKARIEEFIQSGGIDNFDETWDKLLELVRNDLANGKLTKIGSWDYGLSKKDTLKYSSVDTPSQYTFTITKQNVYDAYQSKKARPSGAFQKEMEDVVGYMKKTLQLKDYQQGATLQVSKNKKYVFIIDEINRGEISKIFGELFFSIDPNYRGKKGATKTQYSNMHEYADEVFYVPENVYIIGTMNDIDRSVESFDFAMRRRFTWEEITAEESAENMNLPKEIKDRMAKLNAEISKIDGLNASYHIGGAYFLDKDGKPRTDYETIWEFRLYPLLKEYLRGMSEVEKKLENLKNAYNA